MEARPPVPPARGERRWKVIGRRIAYHGTTMGALSINGFPGLRTPFEPLVPTSCTCETRTASTARPTRPRSSSRPSCSTTSRQAILAAGPETVAMVIMEPVQNSGGAFTPPAGYFQGVRALCDRTGSCSAPTR